MRVDAAQTTSTRTILDWRCTSCGQLNAPDIHRCGNCFTLRDLDAPTVPVRVSAKQVSPQEAEFVEGIKEGGSLSAAVAYVWRRPSRERQRYWYPSVLIGLALLVVVGSALPGHDLAALLPAALVHGVLTAVFSAGSARKYRSDRSFLVAVGVLDAAKVLVWWAAFVVWSSLVSSANESAAQRVIRAVNPTADTTAVVVVVVGLLLALLLGLTWLTRRANGRANADRAS